MEGNCPTIRGEIEKALMSCIAIEPATVGNAVEIAAVFGTARSQNLAYLPRLHTAAEDVAYFARAFITNTVMKAMDGQRIVGFIAFGNGWVNHLYLIPNYQRLGIGGQLLDRAKQEEPSLRLWTFARNTTAQRFYKKHGFFVVKHTDGANNEEKEPDVLFQWNR